MLFEVNIADGLQMSSMNPKKQIFLCGLIRNINLRREDGGDAMDGGMSLREALRSSVNSLARVRQIGNAGRERQNKGWGIERVFVL